jgi:hypothetical protein
MKKSRYKPHHTVYAASAEEWFMSSPTKTSDGTVQEVTTLMRIPSTHRKCATMKL